MTEPLPRRKEEDDAVDCALKETTYIVIVFIRDEAMFSVDQHPTESTRTRGSTRPNDSLSYGCARYSMVVSGLSDVGRQE